MIVIETKAIRRAKNSTVSKMLVDGEFFCYVLEDGLREKKIPGETAIAGGEYSVKRVKHGRHYLAYRDRFQHKFSIHIANVPNFQGIMIHIGNYISDTSGCLLVGETFGMSGANWCVWRSIAAYKRLYNLLEQRIDEEIKIIINR